MASAQTSKPKLLAGFYDPDKRRQQVLERLENELHRFRKLDFTRDVSDQLAEPTEFQREKTLETIIGDIKKLSEEVINYKFEGGHFTKQYRTFQGACEKLLQQLDSLDIETEEDSRKRGQSIQGIQQLIDYINSKVHSNGLCCERCELFGTRWQ